MAKRIAMFAFMVAGCFATPAALAQQLDQMKEFDEYRVYYNLLNTTALEPEVAERYNVTRDEDTALLTISVRAPNEEGVLTDQPAQVSGNATDLVRQMPLRFKEFQDPSAVYYLAEVPVDKRAKLDFSVDIQPRDSGEVYELEFRENLYPRGSITR
jgi:hypothetical protein